MQTVLPQCLVDERVIVFDVETTGFSPTRDRVIQLGVLWVEDNDVVMQGSFYCNPGRSVPWEVTKLTGISQGRVDRASRFESFADFVVDVTASPSVLMAYNATFDLKFLNMELVRCGVEEYEIGDVIDPLIWVRAVDRPKSCKLAAAAERRGVHHTAHNALADCVMTFKVFCSLDGLPSTMEQVIEKQSLLKRGR